MIHHHVLRLAQARSSFADLAASKLSRLGHNTRCFGVLGSQGSCHPASQKEAKGFSRHFDASKTGELFIVPIIRASTIKVFRGTSKGEERLITAGGKTKKHGHIL